MLKTLSKTFAQVPVGSRSGWRLNTFSPSTSPPHTRPQNVSMRRNPLGLLRKPSLKLIESHPRTHTHKHQNHVHVVVCVVLLVSRPCLGAKIRSAAQRNGAEQLYHIKAIFRGGFNGLAYLTLYVET